MVVLWVIKLLSNSMDQIVLTMDIFCTVRRKERELILKVIVMDIIKWILTHRIPKCSTYSITNKPNNYMTK